MLDFFIAQLPAANGWTATAWFEYDDYSHPDDVQPKTLGYEIHEILVGSRRDPYAHNGLSY